MSPGTLARMLRERFRKGSRAWGEACAVGAPEPEEARCRSLDCPTVRLSALGDGDRAVVSCLEAPSGAAARKLASLGLLPGTHLDVVQRFPVWVVRSGYTEIAFDDALAEHVRVHPHA